MLRPIPSGAKKQVSTTPGQWPDDALYFKTFPKDDAYTLVYEMLLERGWKFAGVPYKGDDVEALAKELKKPQPK